MPPKVCGWCRGRLAPNARTVRVEPGGLRVHAEHLVGYEGAEAVVALERALGTYYKEDRMAPKAKEKVTDPWDEIESQVPPSDLPPFATEEERESLAGTVVTITAVRSGETQYGEAWFLDCETRLGARTLTVSAGIPTRDALIAALAERVPIKARWVRRSRSYWLERP